MKQLKMSALLITLTILFAACPNDNEIGHRNINFSNKSGKKIGYQISFDKISNIYQDTVFLCNNTSDSFISNDSTFVLRCPIRVSDWESDLNNSYYVQFLVMDGDNFSQCYTAPCDTIRKYVPIVYCYRLKLEDLQRMNWTVVYPPKE